MQNAVADEATVSAPSEAKVDIGPPPEDFGLKYDYYADCVKVF